MEKKKCSHCNGEGYFTCRNCMGKKLLRVRYQHYCPCPDCNGHGAIICSRCRGSGYEPEEEKA